MLDSEVSLDMKKKKPKIDLDKMEELETQDWVDDKKRREYKKSEEYKKKQELLEKYKKKKK